MAGCFGSSDEDRWKEKLSLHEDICEECEKELTVCECEHNTGESNENFDF